MIPMLIGSGARPLFAVLTPASGARQRRAVVFCPPFGEEYVRAHRTGRVMAERLAARGLDVLRFDYYGTGDSGGDDHEFSLIGAAADVGDACAEVRAVSGASRVTLIGLRDGAAAAILAAESTRAVDRLVLWDPTTIARRPGGIPSDTLVIVSEDSAAHRASFAQLSARAPHVTYLVSPGPPPWVAQGGDGIGPTPVALLGSLTQWIS